MFEPDTFIKLNWYGIGALIAYAVEATIYIKSLNNGTKRKNDNRAAT